MCAKVQFIRTRFDRLFDRIWNFEVLEFLGLNPRVIRCFNVVFSVPKAGTSLNDVMGCVST